MALGFRLVGGHEVIYGCVVIDRKKLQKVEERGEDEIYDL